MQIKLFTIPISDNGSAQTELNRFLQSHKVLKTESHFYAVPNGAAWCFCVNYLPSAANFSAGLPRKKVDYKTVLSEIEFGKFSKLREIRKALATEDAVPAYAVFTDAELAEISKLKTIDTKTVTSIKGIAEKRMLKYGNKLTEQFLHLANEKS